ncbi:MAG: 30S ribosomal protein S12 methylthiotransferase RimO [Bacteroidota bacterium]|nr:30S ribosomal protein S12 methylthiotransferase RimO [Bacteroidota bacterium]MDP4237367.1 30S ribosomal protein S12 methylthiotransferase RimO [Bacteroidota bacterium]
MPETKKIPPKRVSLVTLGCEKNTVDSEVLMGGLRHNGVRLVSDPSHSDIIILNTCGFIESAKRESINSILEAVEMKNSGSVKEVYVAGCLSERYRSELEAEITGVDGYFGTEDFERILRTVVPEANIATGPDLRYELLGERVLTTPKFYSYIKISEGCDNPCSFCAIPIMRGGHRSKSPEEIAFEAMMLAGQGVKEIVLIAQDLTYYGLDLTGERTLSDLLRRLVKVNGIEWIRLMYAYPAKFPLDILDVIAGEEKIVPYLDIPVQHASTEVLKSMRRGITRRATEELIETIRAKVPNIALRTTLITGYPTEGEREFEELEEFVSEMKFDRLGVFTYSVEDGTTAEPLGDTVSEEEKRRRHARLLDIQREISHEKNLAKIGTIVHAIIEREEEGVYYGRTEADAPEVDNEIAIHSQAALQAGMIVNVRVHEADEFDLVGDVIP